MSSLESVPDNVPLRRPRSDRARSSTSSSANGDGGESSNNSNDAEIAMARMAIASKLNPDVAEFTPRWFATPIATSRPSTAVQYAPPPVHYLSQQSRLDKYKDHPERTTSTRGMNQTIDDSSEFNEALVNGFGPVYGTIFVDTSSLASSVPETESSRELVSTLEAFVLNLTRDPGLYNSVETTIMEFLQPAVARKDDLLLLISMADMLFGNAINVPNFHYNGARLCSTIGTCWPEFQGQLHMLCKKGLKEETGHTLCGLAFFLAELHMNIPGETKILYLPLLRQCLDLLLADAKDMEYVKTVCKILKLCNSKIGRDNFAALLYKLENDVPNPPPGVEALIASVRNLHDMCARINWGELTDVKEPKQETQVSEEITRRVEEASFPMFYGPDGDEIPFKYYSNYIDTEEPEDPDMEEMYAQYEKFLSLKK